MENNKAIDNTVSQGLQQLKFSIAMEDPIQHIKELIPLLELRHKLAIDYFKQDYFMVTTSSRSEATEKQYAELMDNLNRRIIELLGL